MTGPEDSQSTRPISVAELLARNGTIGAPPAGGRRRRRRGDTDSISVAELTGEIPIVTDHTIAEREAAAQEVVDEPVAEEPVAEEPAVSEPVAEEPAVEEPEPAEADESVAPVEAVEPVDDGLSGASTNGVVDHQDVDSETVDESEADEADEVDEFDEADEADETDDDYADAVSDYAAHIEQRDTDVDLDFFAPPRRSSYAARRFSALGVDAEEMSPDPDPVDEDSAVDWSDASGGSTEVDDDVDASDTVAAVEADANDSDSTRPYLRATAGPLFGGQTVADDLARGGQLPASEDIDRGHDADRDAEPTAPKTMSSFMHGVWIVGQCVLAVAFGAGLFVAFDQLWKWNNIVALVLSVLVILGLVVGVRVVRKTEDIGSTLIAVAVGALVTLGPLALLQSG
jgi:hypothetical protein